MPITIYEKDTNSADGVNWMDYNTRKSYNLTDVIKQVQPALSNIKTLCADKVTTYYGQNAILRADVLILSRDGSDAKPGALRGFAALLTNKKEGKVYIDLICNGQKANAKTRFAPSRPSGKVMLNAIKDYTRDNGYRYIELKALQHVVPYYYKYGWRFISQCGGKENRARDVQVKNLLDVLKAAGDPDRYTEADEEMVAQALKPFRGYQKGIYSEKEATKTATAAAATARSGAANREELVDDYRDTREILEEGISEHGYTMIWCVNDPDGVAAAGNRARRRARSPSPGPRSTPSSPPSLFDNALTQLGRQAQTVATRAGAMARELGHAVVAAGKGVADAAPPRSGGHKTRKSRRRRKRKKTRRKRKKTRRKSKKARRKRKKTRRKTKRRGRR